MRRTPLKTRTSLRRKTALRSTSVLTARTPLRKSQGRHARIKPRSKKQERKYEVRRPLVAALLAERPWCEIRWDAKCWGRATEVHEPGMRSRGADICDPEQCVTGCHYCHRMVHDHPAEATERGWMIPSGAGCAA
jgi:hypothetical protein